MANWRQMINQEAAKHGDSLDGFVCTLPNEELWVNFDDSYGGDNGKPFVAWSNGRVYFPVNYDGLDTVESVPRHPCETVPRHICGG
ncbi:hypothetical protein ACFOEK_12275 [Litoribrevibacter euphylliae]|uniref:Uncharacterized protein n=1 Tax=Litoribrevibacter euphylliae TaxID=1834034 RepID=A0ABV7HJG4_9GAMM